MADILQNKYLAIHLKQPTGLLLPSQGTRSRQLSHLEKWLLDDFVNQYIYLCVGLLAASWHIVDPENNNFFISVFL